MDEDGVTTFDRDKIDTIVSVQTNDGKEAEGNLGVAKGYVPNAILKKNVAQQIDQN